MHSPLRTASLIIIVILVTSARHSTATSNCNKTLNSNESDKCSMLGICGTEDWTRTVKGYIGEWTEVNCCISGPISSISWWKYKKGKWVTDDKFAEYGVKVRSNNQQILLFSMPLSLEGGIFRCMADVSGNQVVHTFHVIFHEEDCASTYPEVRNPLKNSTTFWNMPGETSELPCDVAFGYCPTENRPLAVDVTWMMEQKLPDGTTRLISVRDGPHYKISMDKTAVSVARSRLTIQNIEATHYRKYYCQLDDGLVTKYWMIQFKKGLPGTGELPKTLIIYQPGFQIGLAMILLLIVTAAITIPIMWHYRIEILLWRHGHKKEKLDLQYIHDALLMHAGTNPMNYAEKDPLADYEFVHRILYKKLQEEFHYNLFMPTEHLDLTQYTVTNYISEMEKSKRIIFIISEQFLQEDLCAEVFSQSLRQEERSSNRNIYIVYRDIPPSVWDSEENEMFGNLETLKVTMNNAKKSWLKVGRTLQWNGTYSLNGDHCLVASDKKSAKQIEKFWKKLCLALPPKEKVWKFNFRPNIQSDSSTTSSTLSTNNYRPLTRNDERHQSIGQVV